MSAPELTGTIELPIKCLYCGLHFTVWTWEEWWAAKNQPFCPECGTQGEATMFPGRRHPDKQIFQFVPGTIDPDDMRDYDDAA